MPAGIINHTELDVAKIGTPSGDVFDVYFYSPYDKLYQAVIGFDGKVIMMKEWKENFDYVSSEAIMNSPLKGRLIVDKTYRRAQNGWTIEIYTNDGHGSKKVIKEYHLYQNEESRYNRYATSTTFKLLSICSQTAWTTTCGQFDQNGVLIFESTLPIPKSSKVFSARTFNLPKGGLLHLIVRCSSSGCEYSGRDFVVKKFDATGAYVGSVPVTQFSNLYRSTRIHFFENVGGEMCLSMLDNRDTFNRNVTLNIACFEDQDFYP